MSNRTVYLDYKGPTRSLTPDQIAEGVLCREEGCKNKHLFRSTICYKCAVKKEGQMFADLFLFNRAIELETSFPDYKACLECVRNGENTMIPHERMDCPKCTKNSKKCNKKKLNKKYNYEDITYDI